MRFLLRPSYSHTHSEALSSSLLSLRDSLRFSWKHASNTIVSLRFQEFENESRIFIEYGLSTCYGKEAKAFFTPRRVCGHLHAERCRICRMSTLLKQLVD